MRKLHYIVDGWNIIHAFPDMADILKLHGLIAAQEAFIAKMIVLHDNIDCRLTIVFDGKGKTLEITRPKQDNSFSVIHTLTGQTADDFIEAFVASNKLKKYITVVSNDNLVCQTAHSFGAFSMSSESFLSLLNLANTCKNERVQNAHYKAVKTPFGSIRQRFEDENKKQSVKKINLEENLLKKSLNKNIEKKQINSSKSKTEIKKQSKLFKKEKKQIKWQI